MSSINRFAGRIGSALLILALVTPVVVRAQTAKYVFENRPIAFTHLSNAAGAPAVGIDDPALRGLLKQLGASLTWRPGERYVLIATAQPQVVSFSVGDAGFSVGPISAQASFAPFLIGSEVYLPLADLLRALYLAPIAEDGATVLQPQLASIDVEGSSSQAVLIARAAMALHARITTETADRVVYEFDGVGSLVSTRAYTVGGIRSVDVNTTGTVRDPKTFITVSLLPGTRHDVTHSNNGDFEVGFGANGGAPPLVAAVVAPSTQTPTSPPAQSSSQPMVTASPEDSAMPQAGMASPSPGAVVDSVGVQSNSSGTTVTIAVTGNATYEWHRLREPDNRFWIDITGAQLAGGPQDQNEADPLISMRVRQTDAQTVRVALSLTGEKSIGVLPSANGITISIGRDEVADETRSGEGNIGSVVSVSEVQAAVTPVPPEDYGQGGDENGAWKFGPRQYVPTNPKLIVIDPGHGGGDRGASRGGLDEATLTLDMANRLKALLIARGWQVELTRTDDHDVLATPASTAEAERKGYHTSAANDLQARDDIANSAGARLFVSIHANSYINSGPFGTTVYYSKPSDVALAQIIDRLLPSRLGTKDDGMIKSKFYVTLNAEMPAILVETAFLSNPDDFQKLASPEWRQKVAITMADGIDAYAQANPVPTGANQ